jgi:proteasome lid subunit RPN8/RPN11
MSSVIINEKALETAIRHAQSSPDNEVIGVLVGKQKGNDLVITDAIPSQHGHSDNVSVSLLNEFQALVAEKLMREGGNDYIVGIYHSHPGFGCFFSDTDTGTQLRIQQMFPQAVAMVIDPFRKGGGVDYRFYRVESGKVIELTPKIAREMKKPELRKPVVVAPVPVVQAPVPQLIDSRISTYLVIAAIVISLCALVIAGITYIKVSDLDSKFGKQVGITPNPTFDVSITQNTPSSSPNNVAGTDSSKTKPMVNVTPTQ